MIARHDATAICERSDSSSKTMNLPTIAIMTGRKLYKTKPNLNMGEKSFLEDARTTINPKLDSKIPGKVLNETNPFSMP